MGLELKAVTKAYGHNGRSVTAVKEISLTVGKGEFLCLLGPSGCGKSTLMNIMAGFEQPTSGTVEADGLPVLEPSPRRVTIFQNYGLLPWRTVERNIMLGLEGTGMGRNEMKEVVARHVKLVGLGGFEEYHPHHLSGGMQQRVAIARSLAVDPDVIFMDEPFGSLDALTRMDMQDMISDLAVSSGKTIVFITHDLEEAVYLADRIVIMTPNPGQVKRVIPVPLARRRDRRSPDFLTIRDRVFDEFRARREDETEYYL